MNIVVHDGSDTLTLVNLMLSLADFVMVVALAVFIRRRTNQSGMSTMGHVHALVGTTLLVFYAFLGLTSALGAIGVQMGWDGPVIVLIQVAAVMFRTAIFLILSAWVALTAERYWHRRRQEHEN